MSEIRDRTEVRIRNILGRVLLPENLIENKDELVKGRMIRFIDVHRIETLKDLILSIPEIAVVDREARLPVAFGDPIEFNKALLKAGWVKEVKK